MKSKYTRTDKLFIGFGIITIISGIFLIIEKDYLMGISGASVGMLIIYQNMREINAGKNE